MNLLTYLYRQSWPLLLVATIGGLAGGLSAAALVAVISKGISGSAPMHTLAWPFVGLCLLHVAAKSGAEIALLNLTQNAIARLRVSLSQKLLKTPFKQLQSMGKARLLVILTKDIETFIQSFQFLPHAFGNVVIILSCFGYLAWLSWKAFIVITACLLLGMVAFHFAQRLPLKKMARVREQTDTLYQHFRGLTEGSKELQLNAQRGERFVGQVIEPAARDFRKTFIQGMTGFTAIINTGNIMFYVVMGVFLFALPHWMPQDAVTVTSVALILLYLIQPIGDLMVMLPPLQQAAIALEKIQQLDDVLVPAGPAPALAADPFATTGPLQLELRGVCHKYPGLTDDSHFMLGPVELTVQQGEILFIVGGNGSGKTTLAMVLLGLYEPEAGAMRLNGVPVTDENRDSYRQYFSAVFADFHLFEHLLDADRPELGERAMRYIELLGMSHKVQVVDGKFSTIDLSTGQRKRLALVSAYLEDRPIYLFDEWAADQDPVFKRVFYTELLPELKARGKTVLCITHDDAYFPLADRVIKVQDGQLHPMPAPAPAPAPAELQVA